MADNTKPEIPQGPVAASQNAVSPDAEAGKTQEISAPMLDVHAPHEPISTWKGFLLHIATIVIGLLIAVGLEQTVEYFHHRHEIREAREALAAEHEENIRRYHQTVRDHLVRIANQNNDQRVLRYLLAPPATPQDKLPGVMTFGEITLAEPVEAAWST